MRFSDVPHSGGIVLAKPELKAARIFVAPPGAAYVMLRPDRGLFDIEIIPVKER